MTLFQISLFIHIFAGFTALCLFWIPVVTKKGGRLHNLVGWAYTISMFIVSLTAFHLAATRLFSNEIRSALEDAFSYFLLFIAILSAATAWYGIRVLRFKKRKVRHTEWPDLFVSALLVISGTITTIHGFIINVSLLMFFPLIGVALGSLQLLYWLKKPKERMHWLYQHIGGMLGCSIATITAFLVFGAPKLQ